MVEISMVLPAYNEASRIENTVENTAAALSRFAHSFEIIIAEYGMGMILLRVHACYRRAMSNGLLRGDLQVRVRNYL